MAFEGERIRRSGLEGGGYNDEAERADEAGAAERAAREAATAAARAAARAARAAMEARAAVGELGEMGGNGGEAGEEHRRGGRRQAGWQRDTARARPVLSLKRVFKNLEMYHTKNRPICS